MLETITIAQNIVDEVLKVLQYTENTVRRKLQAICMDFTQSQSNALSKIWLLPTS